MTRRNPRIGFSLQITPRIRAGVTINPRTGKPRFWINGPIGGTR